MNLTRFLGVVTLTTGISVILGELAVGQQRLLELTGVPLIGLYPLSVLNVVLGAVAVYTSILEEREAHPQHDET